jgi:hypothetical protein
MRIMYGELERTGKEEFVALPTSMQVYYPGIPVKGLRKTMEV